jgi:hypothetical protein
MARAAIVPPNAPMPTISICMFQLTAAYAAKKLVLAGKVTCGVRSETSGLSSLMSSSMVPL